MIDLSKIHFSDFSGDHNISLAGLVSQGTGDVFGDAKQFETALVTQTDFTTINIISKPTLQK